MAQSSITSGQMKRLQVLYAQLARRTMEGTDRASRLVWAAAQIGRSIASFHDLTQDEARHLIDSTQAQLGVKVPPKKRLDRDAAHRAGTEGRRSDTSNQSTLVSPADMARIQHALEILGWSQAQLDGWLRSPSSPLRNHSQASIRTLGDANRVWWALKRMAVARGLWKEKRTV